MLYYRTAYSTRKNHAHQQQIARPRRPRRGTVHRRTHRLLRQRQRLQLDAVGVGRPGGDLQIAPSDFPKSDVPIVAGTVLVANGDHNDGWSVTVQPKDKNGFADAKAALEKAGYTVQPGATDSKAVYKNDKYTVAIGTPGVAVTYLVTAN
ncbi:hypothetical protein ACRAWC_11895 [Leifsonia sp. L25]|uniref:hypothetical protein n=1 Tax=Leifsonia sp. L25 TaxID=3423957 RepID=UPI003D68A5E9